MARDHRLPLHSHPTSYAAAGADTRPVAVLVFGEHAREVITTELGLWLSRVLLGEANASVLAWPQTAAAFKEAGLLDLTLPGSSGAAGRRAAARRSLRDPGSAVEGGGSSQEEEEGVSAAGSESASEGLGSSLGGGAGWRSRKLQEASVVEAAAFWSKYILERLALQVRVGGWGWGWGVPPGDPSPATHHTQGSSATIAVWAHGKLLCTFWVEPLRCAQTQHHTFNHSKWGNRRCSL